MGKSDRIFRRHVVAPGQLLQFVTPYILDLVSSLHAATFIPDLKTPLFFGAFGILNLHAITNKQFQDMLFIHEVSSYLPIEKPSCRSNNAIF